MSEWDKLKQPGIWSTTTMIADLVLPTLSQLIERPILVIQNDTIIQVNGIENFSQPPNSVNELPIVIIKTGNHYDAAEIEQPSIWGQISKELILNNKTATSIKDVVNLLPDIFPNTPNTIPASSMNKPTEDNMIHNPTSCQCYSCVNNVILPEQPKDNPKPKRAKRLLVDARWINKHLEMQITNMPLIDEMMETFSEPNVVTGSLDLTQFYWQIPVSEQYGKYFTIATHLGTHTPQVVVQGDQSAPRAGQTTINKIIEGIPGCIALIDDIAIAAPTPDEFLNRLEKVLQRLVDYGDPNFGPGIKLRGDKMVILSDNIKYMGMKVIKGHLYADQEKADKILQWQVPEDLIGLQSYASFVSYFRPFFKNTSIEIAPIIDLQKLPKYSRKEHWTQKHQDIFDKVKVLLTSLPALKIADTTATGGHLHVFHDWSKKGYAGLLAQETTDPSTGKTFLEPVQYFSRLAKNAELRYKVSEGEMNSAVMAIQKWQHFLRGRPFILHSDSSVVYHVLKNYKNTSKVLSRLASDIQGMSFKVKHISTKDNPMDYFSRLVVNETRICDTDKEHVNIPDLDKDGHVELTNEPHQSPCYSGDDMANEVLDDTTSQPTTERKTILTNIKQAVTSVSKTSNAQKTANLIDPVTISKGVPLDIV